jgi:hypothetical protein
VEHFVQMRGREKKLKCERKISGREGRRREIEGLFLVVVGPAVR